jgi:hypothetical protein
MIHDISTVAEGKNVRLQGGHKKNYLLRFVEVVKRGRSSQKPSEEGGNLLQLLLRFSDSIKKVNNEISD